MTRSIEDRLRRQDENCALAADEGLFLSILAACEPKRRGSRWWCRCPFHADKNPSGRVWCYQGRWMFGCFPCGLTLDVFALVMRLESCGFRAARERLGARSATPAAPTPAPRETRPLVVACDGVRCPAWEPATWENIAAGLDGGDFRGGRIRLMLGEVRWLCRRCTSRARCP